MRSNTSPAPRPARQRMAALGAAVALAVGAAVAIPIAAHAEDAAAPAVEVAPVVTEELIIEEPVAVEPVAVEPVAVEPVAEEPFAEASDPAALAVPGDNHAPVAVDDHHTVIQGGSLVVPAPGFLANDSDPDGDAFVGDHTGGFLVGFGWHPYNGDITYTPANNATGTVVIDYWLRDVHGMISNKASIVIEIVPAGSGQEPANTPPVAADDAYTTPMGTALSIDAPGVLANDSDPEGDPLKISDHEAGANGWVALQENGQLQYTPKPGFVGTETFTYFAFDGAVYDAATITIEVTPVADPCAGTDVAVDEAGAIPAPAPDCLPTPTDEPGEPADDPADPTDPTDEPAGEPTQPTSETARTDTAATKAAGLAETGIDTGLVVTLASLLAAVGIALRFRRRTAEH